MNFRKIVNRIKEAKGLSRNYEVAELLGFKNTAFSDRLKRNSIPFDKLENFCLKESISQEWLFTGKGKPFSAQEPPQAARQSIGKWYVVKPVDEETETLKPILIPRREGEDYVWYMMKTNDFVPLAEKGDVVIINTEFDRKRLSPNSTYAVRQGNREIILAYAQQGEHGYFLVPYSPALEPIPYADARVIGVVTELRRSFRS